MQEVNIQHASSSQPSMENSGKTLAPKMLLEALRDFANTGIEPERVSYFRNRWPGFLDDLVYTGYTISIASPSDPSLHTEPRRETWPMWKLFAQFRQLVREAWIGNETILGILLRVGIEEEGTEDCVMPDWRRSGFRYAPRTNFQAAVYELLKHSRHARVCANPDCPAPYFLTADPRRKFCSVECTQPAQREWRRKWWEQHGKQWREQRGKKRKSTERRPRR